MSAKRKGSTRERAARACLEDAGYWVIKAGGSLGMYDLVAIPGDLQPGAPNAVRLIQVKSNRWPGVPERLRMAGLTLPAYCTVEMWRFDDYRGWRRRRWDGQAWTDEP